MRHWLGRFATLGIAGLADGARSGRADWLQVIWQPKYCPQFNRKERGWRYLKRDARSQLARTLCAFAGGILAGLARLGAERLDIVHRVPDWFLAGHRQTAHRPAQMRTDSYQRSSTRRQNSPAAT